MPPWLEPSLLLSESPRETILDILGYTMEPRAVDSEINAAGGNSLPSTLSNQRTMKSVTVEYALEVKAVSEAIILSHGGEVHPGLPYLDRSGVRSQADLVGRALALNAIIDLNFDVDSSVVKNWVTQHRVACYLTEQEASLLERDKDAITEQEKNNLAWSLDALWALMWAGGLIDELDFSSPIPDEMYEMCPHVRDNDGPDKFADKMSLRSFGKLYRSLDLYYRLHWFAFQYGLRGEYETFDCSRFIERRKALEWLLSPDLAWDDVSLNT